MEEVKTKLLKEIKKELVEEQIFECQVLSLFGEFVEVTNCYFKSKDLIKFVLVSPTLKKLHGEGFYITLRKGSGDEGCHIFQYEPNNLTTKYVELENSNKITGMQQYQVRRVINEVLDILCQKYKEVQDFWGLTLVRQHWRKCGEEIPKGSN